MTVEQKTEYEQMRMQLPLPCLLSVARDEFLPRLPSLRLKMAAGKKSITSVGLNDLSDRDMLFWSLRSANRICASAASTMEKILGP